MMLDYPVRAEQAFNIVRKESKSPLVYKMVLTNSWLAADLDGGL